jgi:hypothetical protein
MPGDFPDVLSDVFVTVHDFNSGDIIAFGRMDVRFIEHTDRLRVMRERFTGEFTPDTPEDKATLDRDLITAMSAGTMGHKLQVEHGGKTWTLTVKFGPGEAAFPFTGRQDPKVVA